MSRDDERRIKRVQITDEIIYDLLSGRFVRLEGLPDDAMIRRTYRDATTDSWWFVFQSDTFNPVEEGEVIPEHEMVVVTENRLRKLVDIWRRYPLPHTPGEAEIFDYCADGLEQFIRDGTVEVPSVLTDDKEVGK